ncbi:MAG TPA: FAD-dependent oxidoreductase, partial [Planctomycetota bacterium]|nr:FAD-dependent oxidoreductase [Planctomycetota bacterium]
MERDPASSRPETAARADPAASGDSVRSNPGHHRVVVVGGGFGGLEVVRHLRREKTVSVTLVDRRNFHLFQPLLYQVATGGLSPANIAAPYRAIFSRQKNCDIVLGEVVDFDPERRRVILRDGELEYDTLVVAAGSRHGYFGHDEWEEIAPGLKTLEDALEIRRRIYSAFETADRSDDEAERHAFLTFVIVGAGPTGVELAGTLAEIARHTLRHDFRHIDPGIARIYLLDAGPKVLGAYPDELSDSARASLERLGVTVRTGTTVRSIEPGRVHVTSPTDGDETIEARTIIW